MQMGYIVGRKKYMDKVSIGLYGCAGGKSDISAFLLWYVLLCGETNVTV